MNLSKTSGGLICSFGHAPRYINKRIMRDFPKKYCVKISFEESKLPPFDDILVIGNKCPHGKKGIAKVFEYLVPDEFVGMEVNDKNVEAIFVNNRILKKMDKNFIINLLSKRVFPYISANEILKVDFKIMVMYDSIEIED